MAQSPWLRSYSWVIDGDPGILGHMLFSVYWTQTLRKAIMAQFPEGAPGVICGHPKDVRHATYWAVPDVGHRYADGHILGLQFWIPDHILPFSADDTVIAAACNQLTHLDVPGPNGLFARVAIRQLTPTQNGPRGLLARMWQGPQHGTVRWVSTTPVVFDRYPDDPRNLNSYVQQMAQWAGLPTVRQVRTLPNSPLPGVPNARTFHLRSNRVRQPFVTHLEIEFSEPVRGPVLLGKLRYFGLGIFRPVLHAIPETFEESPSNLTERTMEDAYE